MNKVFFLGLITGKGRNPWPSHFSRMNTSGIVTGLQNFSPILLIREIIKGVHKMICEFNIPVPPPGKLYSTDFSDARCVVEVDHL